LSGERLQEKADHQQSVSTTKYLSFHSEILLKIEELGINTLLED